MNYLALTIISAVGLLGLVLAWLGLPGTWISIGVAAGINYWWIDDLYSWWTLGGCVALGVFGEILEFAASSFGSRTGGGGRRGAVGAVIGAVAGAILGAGFPPVIGAVLWSVFGAGVGAVIGEISSGMRTWREVIPIGQSAAKGRFLGVLAKGLVGLAVYVILIGGAIIA